MDLISWQSQKYNQRSGKKLEVAAGFTCYCPVNILSEDGDPLYYPQIIIRDRNGLIWSDLNQRF